MPVYGVAQAGYNPAPNQGLNLASLEPGESIVLFSGAETPSTGLKSVAFARGYSAGVADNGITFDATGMPSDMTIDVQVANNDIDAQYTSVATLSASTTPDTGNAAYTDTGRSAFYRLYVSAYTAGTMPKVKAQR
jgi:hypothetical protein